MIDTTIVLVTASQLLLVPVVIGASGLVKIIQGFNTAYTPFVAVALGIGFSALLLTAMPINVLQIVVGGLIVGLTACGLYSGTSSVRNAE